ncbi:NPCBM/NEW2 domain protein [Rubripirellula tenax]|uniref:NPCBM/NEW2 domain protein n=1 Tax=Rubripirellula tenax TaxID=2528015 RepID=A0A5C6FJZ3_9BACT|nr:NPCBM/NEW2 domain-containing protein [Rubripirellula tenax]TWU59992.1 NPCBM/NEW2 domain protein [Rubripirellula tenax]
MNLRSNRLSVHHFFLAVVATAVFVAAAAPVHGVDARPRADATEIATADRRIRTSANADGVASPGQVVVVYFTPKDRTPAADHVARMRRIVNETAGFYSSELERHGFPDRTMNVLRNADGEVDVIDVVGDDADESYGKPDGGRIRDEVIPILRQRQIDPDRSVLLLFCNLMDYDAAKSTISHHSPYYGGGNRLSGTAWQCDSELLDPLRLRDTTPLRDGEYGNITIGKHVSIFIGGVIHELGHALGLPHCRQRKDEAVRGTSLMGSGNRTYAEQLRGEGKGTFLTQTHAIRLAAHPAMVSRVPRSVDTRSSVQWNDLRVSVDANRSIVVRGSVESSIAIHGVIAYFDPEGHGDYDATTASAVPREGGEFGLQCGDLPPGRRGQLRLVTCHVNGSTTQRVFSYEVNGTGKPVVSSARLEVELEPMIEALRREKLDEAKAFLAASSGDDETLRKIGQAVIDRFEDTDASPDRKYLSEWTPLSESVGWLKPTYDCVPDQQRLLSIDGDYFARGIYAHAPAEHGYHLDGEWKRLTGRCGLQAEHPGSVGFQILGDGKVLWRAKKMQLGESATFDIPVAGVNTLTLRVDEGGDGAGGDWGVWIEPLVSR